MTLLFGHDAAVAAFRAALDAGRLHHAWLLAGPQGVGKGTFARAASLHLLSTTVEGDGLSTGFNTSIENQSSRYFSSRTHPDFRLLKREVWGGKPPNDYIVPENERKTDDAPARGIRVKQVRLIAPFFTTRPALSTRRAVVIDSADELEPEAANALLKILEEPPPETVFFLISHAPDRLLPTIRSRCRLLRFKPLEDDAMASALRAAAPDAGESEIAALVRIGGGAPGRAIAQRGLDLDALDSAMKALIRDGDPTNAARSALAQSLSLKAAQPRYEAFLARAPAAIAVAARDRRGPALAEALALWERAVALAGAARRLSLDPVSTVFELAGMLATLNPGEGRRAA